MEPWKWFFFLTLSCIATQSFFGMLEMACVSFNKVRLQYYISEKYKSAIWLNTLLNRPSWLFGTTLIMVNASLLIGSESSRRLYESLGISPGWAPITQAFLVLVFAEIVPLFIGRRYAEFAARLGVPVLYFFAHLLRPLIWTIDMLCRFINHILGLRLVNDLYLSREELQNVIEEREETVTSQEKTDLNTVVSNIFSLKSKTAKELMRPIEEVFSLASSATVGELRKALLHQYVPYAPLYHKDLRHIIAIIYPRDLLRLSDTKKIRDHARSAWFITETMSALQILKQFRKNNQSVAVVLSENGSAVGILTLDELIDTIFGKIDAWMSFGEIAPKTHQVVLDRAFPADMLLSDFNQTYQVRLEFKEAKTLLEAMQVALGHTPVEGEIVRVDQFELMVEESTFIGPKTISVRTIY